MRILLETSSVNALSGCHKEQFIELTDRLRSKGAQLCVLFTTLGERYARENGKKDYNRMLRRTVDHFTLKGLELRITQSELFIPGITTKGMAKETSPFCSQLFYELTELIEKCEKPKNPNKPIDNIQRDAIIGVSSLCYDFFITSDYCLNKSLDKIIKKYRNKLPNIPINSYRCPKKENILDEINKHL